MPLFQPLTIRGVTLPNRIVKSAMAEGLCDAQGLPKPGLAKAYGRWSSGGVGLAITGMAHLMPGCTYTGGEIGLHDDAAIQPLREVTAAVHRHPGKIFAQLCHAPPQLPRPYARRLGGSTGMSAGFNKTNLLWDRALTDGELHAIARAFGQAARRAREAGFDGVQLHGAHGYLLSRSFSPRHNRRKDGWGGDFEGRLRLLFEVYRQVRGAVGEDYPVTVKLNAHDGQARGLDLDTAVRIGRRLEEWGIDAIEVSAGTGDVGLGFFPNKGKVPIEPGKEFLRANFRFLAPVLPLFGPFLELAAKGVALEREAYFWPLARRFADELSVPILCVGGVRSRSMAMRILTESKVAAVSLARPLVRQPTLPRTWQAGGPDLATCESCNQCFVQIGLGQPLKCHLRPSRAPFAAAGRSP